MTGSGTHAEAIQLRAVGAAAIFVLVGLGCSRASPPGEPTGATWRPILAASEGVMAPPPPPAGSAASSAELSELRGLGARRSEATRSQVAFWDQGACIRWNEIARDLVARNRASHTMASRVYALVSVAQYDALVATWRSKYQHLHSNTSLAAKELSPLLPVPSEPSYPSEHAAVAGASAAVLEYLYPAEKALLQQKASEHRESRLLAGVNFRSDLDAGEAIGRGVAAQVIARAESDGAKQAASGTFTGEQNGWHPSRNHEAIDPAWGRVRPWLMRTGSQFRAPPPPAYDSPAFKSALDEVLRLTTNRTEDQLRLAAFWADGRGSYAPAGRWNRIAEDLIRSHHLSELRAARVFALLNMALMDAGVAAWDTKYHYLVKRPSQMDERISTPIEEPSSPSYTCSHAAFSGAGAEVLAYLFPDDAATLRQKAEEAAMSRVYAGIQFRFEGEAGLAGGRQVAKLAIERARSDGAK
jgi:membrane-associated phospholipid phosphatase